MTNMPKNNVKNIYLTDSQKKSFFNKKDDILLDLLAGIYFLLIILNIVAGVVPLFNISIEYVSLAFKMIILVGLILCFPTMLSRVNKEMIFFLFGIVIVFLIQEIFFHSLNSYFSATFITFITTCMPLVLLVFAVNDISKAYDKFLFISKITLWIAIAVFAIMFFCKIKYNNGDYSMGFSYAILIPTLLCFNEFVNKHKIINFVSAIFGIILIIILGSRGAVVCFGVFVFVKSFKHCYQKHNYVLFIVLCVSTIILLFTYKPILEVLLPVLRANGIYIRTLELLIAPPDLDISSGRIEIFTTIWNEFIRNPFAIRGINAEYVIVGMYAHNIFLEIFYQVGLILAIPIISVLVLFSYNILFSKIFDKKHDFILVLFCAVMPSLMISGCFWESMNFWLWFAFSVKLYSENSKRNAI